MFGQIPRYPSDDKATSKDILMGIRNALEQMERRLFWIMIILGAIAWAALTHTVVKDLREDVPKTTPLTSK